MSGQRRNRLWPGTNAPAGLRAPVPGWRGCRNRAAACRRHGCRGWPSEPWRCPVGCVRWLNQRIPHWIGIGRGRISGYLRPSGHPVRWNPDSPSHVRCRRWVNTCGRKGPGPECAPARLLSRSIHHRSPAQPLKQLVHRSEPSPWVDHVQS